MNANNYGAPEETASPTNPEALSAKLAEKARRRLRKTKPKSFGTEICSATSNSKMKLLSSKILIILTKN